MGPPAPVHAAPHTRVGFILSSEAASDFSRIGDQILREGSGSGSGSCPSFWLQDRHTGRARGRLSRMDRTSGPRVWSRKADTVPEGRQGLLSLLWATSKHCGCLGLDSLSGSFSPFLLSPSFDCTTVYWEPVACHCVGCLESRGEKPKSHPSCWEGNPQTDGLRMGSLW